MPHSITHNDACLALFNKNWGIPRVVKVRKYQHCGADYAKLAVEPNTMPEVRDRYFRIAKYYQELADTEPTSATPAERDNGESPS